LQQVKSISGQRTVFILVLALDTSTYCGATYGMRITAQNSLSTSKRLIKLCQISLLPLFLVTHVFNLAYRFFCWYSNTCCAKTKMIGQATKPVSRKSRRIPKRRQRVPVLRIVADTRLYTRALYGNVNYSRYLSIHEDEDIVSRYLVC
jgi:hypothetical protein